MTEKHECSGAEKHGCLQTSAEECARSCQNISSMFIFGRADEKNGRCFGSKCTCVCETAATTDGSCNVIGHSGYDLYKYETDQSTTGSTMMSSNPTTTSENHVTGKTKGLLNRVLF